MKRSRKIWYLLLVSLLTVGVNAQSIQETLNRADLFLTQANAETKREVHESLIEIIEVLQTVREKETDHGAFLRKVFLKTNRKKLRRYSLYSTFAETMQSGNYGCLSGTILYSLLLSHFNFEFEAIELSDHVYLMVKNNTSTFIFESTLGARGFISNKEEVDAALSSYSQRSLTMESIQAVASLKSSEKSAAINNKIGLTELAGLQFYNQALENYKDDELMISFDFAIESHKLYPSVRIKQLMQLLVSEVISTEGLSQEVKKVALNNYFFHVREKSKPN